MRNDCPHIAHPLSHFTGTSQLMRNHGAPDPGDVSVDGRSFSDFLAFIEAFSLHVNHYDASLTINDWFPFFNSNLPFAIARIARIRPSSVESDFLQLKTDLNNTADTALIQWVVDFIYNESILPWNHWNDALSISDNILFRHVNKAITGELGIQLREFIAIVNACNVHFAVKKPPFHGLLESPVWGLEIPHLMGINDSFIHAPGGPVGRIAELITLLEGVFLAFQENLDILVGLATEENFVNEQVLRSPEISQKHPAHAALLYTFLELFKTFQNQANGLTKKHIEYFLNTVLGLKQKDVLPDKAHIVIELQKNSDNAYLVEQGTKLKDGKDNNKADIFFELDEDIVVNRAVISQLKTLFLNFTNLVKGNHTHRYVGGVYIAPVADTLDGIAEPLSEETGLNWFTLGSNKSKLLLPEKTNPEPHPFGRLGFVLASPVLLLKEGDRSITITLTLEQGEFSDIDELDIDKLKDALSLEFHFLTVESIENAIKNGLSEVTTKWIMQQLLGRSEINITTDEDFILGALGLPAEDKALLNAEVEKRKVFKISFSGEKEWVVPRSFTSDITKSSDDYTLTIEIDLEAEDPSVVFYNQEILGDRLDTELPLVKIEIDPTIPIRCDSEKLNPDCCLERCVPKKIVAISSYEFFKGMQVIDSEICVSACGLKDLVVQNDENVMDVNGLIYPFGTRPDIADFSIVDPAKQIFCITKEFIEDAVTSGVSNATEDYLKGLTNGGKFFVGSSVEERDAFLSNLPASVVPDKTEIEALLNVSEEKYCPPVLEGPNFYVGSEEVFHKNWGDIWLNISWKDKPSNFNDYYKAYVVDGSGLAKNYGLTEDNFEVNLSVLDEGQWYREKENDRNIDHDLSTTMDFEPNPITNHNNRYLFRSSYSDQTCPEVNKDPEGVDVYDMTIQASNIHFDSQKAFVEFPAEFAQYEKNSPYGFMRLSLENQDFLHKDYPFVLARQMMAFGRFTGDEGDLIDGAVYADTNGVPHVYRLGLLLGNFKDSLTALSSAIIDGQLTQLFQDILDAVDDLVNEITTPTDLSDLTDLTSQINDVLLAIGSLPASLSVANRFQLSVLYNEIFDVIESFHNVVGVTLADVQTRVKEHLMSRVNSIVILLNEESIFGELPESKKVLIPNEPYTPVIQNISLDYNACADGKHINLIHLHAFENTFEEKDITSSPTLFPVYTDEGSLFLGVENLVPSSNLNILFQLAETTADSESNAADVKWHYLRNNRWILLRPGFEIIADDTEKLTKSGIIKIAVPHDISLDGHTILPDNIAWIKVSAAENVAAVAETLGIHTQAVKATFHVLKENDLQRLVTPLPAGSLGKLLVADQKIKKVDQPYDSFDGRVFNDSFYLSSSEVLHHRGRGIAAFGYERLLMEHFSEIHLAKCIQHSLGISAREYLFDLELAPGYVLLAVIPDVSRLSFADRFAPLFPVSKLNKMEQYLKGLISPFVQIKAMNPRYEKVNMALRVVFQVGKDDEYYKSLLSQELRKFISSWVEGDSSQLHFGRALSLSSILLFIENRSYVDYVLELQIQHSEDKNQECETDPLELCGCDERTPKRKASADAIFPLTARSILVAGNIQIVVCKDSCIDQTVEWKKSWDFHKCDR